MSDDELNQDDMVKNIVAQMSPLIKELQINKMEIQRLHANIHSLESKANELKKEKLDLEQRQKTVKTSIDNLIAQSKVN